jgi:hypothetical protein
VADAFLRALREGDFDGLIRVLDPDVVLHDDSASLPGGTATMRGAGAVGRYALRYSRRARFVRPAVVEGAAGLVIVVVGRVFGALRFTVRGDRIAEIELISERSRLRGLERD